MRYVLLCCMLWITACSQKKTTTHTSDQDIGDNAPASICHNGILEPGETCDSNCPTACPSSNACQQGILTGQADTCTSKCTYTDKTACVDNDGCCPSNCHVQDDVDCMICSASENPEGLKVILPDDEEPHYEEIEWWYWTGHLQTLDGRWFGFEWVVFMSNVSGQWMRIGHYAISDLQDQTFHFTSHFAFGRPPDVEGGYDLEVPQMRVQGKQGVDHMHGEVDDYVLDITIEATKSPVFHYDIGYTDYPFGGNTYYYSRERMKAAGTLQVGGKLLDVSGSTWFDHQWGALGQAQNLGWDWFSIALDDNREIMLFIIRVPEGQNVINGTYTDASCNSTNILAEDISIMPIGEWTSPDTKHTYPSGWNITVLGMDFQLTPLLADQEIHGVLPGVDYWEGACLVTGVTTGRAYVELTSY